MYYYKHLLLAGVNPEIQKTALYSYLFAIRKSNITNKGQCYRIYNDTQMSHFSINGLNTFKVLKWD